jgi:hypothetical protein
MTLRAPESTRALLASLPALLREAVQPGPDGYRLILGNDLVLPLLKDEAPVRAFSPGWRPGLLLTLFLPVLLLEFRAEDGGGGFWLLDGDGRYLANRVDDLDPALSERIRLPVALALRWLQADAMPGLPCAPPPLVVALLHCHPAVRQGLARVAGAADGLDEAARLRFERADPAELGREPDVGPAGLADRVMPSLQPLAPGWRAVRLLTLTSPLLILELVHENGDTAVWYLDRSPAFLTNQATGLRDRPRAQLRDWCRLWFAALGERFVDGPAVEPGEALGWFLAAGDRTRADLLTFHMTESGLDRTPPAYWRLGDTLPPAMRYVVPVAASFPPASSPPARLAPLDPNGTGTACNQPLRDELIRVAARGVMRFVSPVSGRPFEAAPRGFYLDHHAFAYQLHDAATGLTFFVLCLGEHFVTAGLYLPGAELAVVRDEHQYATARVYLDVIRPRLLGHLSGHAPDIVPALLAPPGAVVHAFRGKPAIHLGHFVWQDLSGVAILIDGVRRQADAHGLDVPPPRCLVFDTPLHPEIYGPLDEIFPELEGRVDRFAHGFGAHAGAFYRARQTVVKVTSLTVPAEVGVRILAALRRAPLWADVAASSEAARASGPVVLVGLRVGNRTLSDMQGFAIRLARLLADAIGRVTIVIDGHNSAGPEPGGTYASFGDTLTGGSTFMAEERRIAEAVSDACASDHVAVIDLIGRPVQESVLWCAQADFFVAPWGAALAKYRWVCNRPGLALAGRWNLEQRHDLAIYHHPGAMESPSPLLFNAPEGTIDLPDQPPDRANYKVDEQAVFAQVRGLIDSCART